MENIRKAKPEDLSRIAEIMVFNYRLNFYPIFKSDSYYFIDLGVPQIMEEYRPFIENMWVYDDGAVKGFVHAENSEVKKLFVEPILHGNGIGAELLEYAVKNCGANFLWALEKNERAIKFYERHGFCLTSERKPEEDTTEYLVRMKR